MRIIPLLIIFAGLFMITLGLIKSDNKIQFKKLLHSYFSFKLHYHNIYNIIIFYPIVFFIIFFFDPLNMKFFSVKINYEGLLYYHLIFTHPYVVNIFFESIKVALAFSILIDFLLFLILSFISLIITKSKYSIAINYFFFYSSIVILAFFNLR